MTWQPGVTLTRTHLGLAVGDAIVITVLISIGLASHETNPLATPGATLVTVIPFLVGWIVAALLTGMYRPDTTSAIDRTITNTAGTWILAALIGSGLRATAIFPGDAPPVFVLVMIGTGLIAMSFWRLIATSLITQLADRGHPA